MKFVFFFILILSFHCLGEFQNVPWYLRKYYHKMKILDDDDTAAIANLSDLSSFEKILEQILIVRNPQTQGSTKVRKFIVETLKKLNWSVELDKFQDKTPLGQITFTNIIATWNSDAPRHLLISCHYDSKYNDTVEFVTATDSAVPCAIMIDIALKLDHYLKKDRKTANDISLQFIFFDGEEAYRKWTSEDSLYGSRHLASLWQQSAYPLDNKNGTTELNRIDLFVLLDLLGTRNPLFYNYFQNTKAYYRSLVKIEMRLRNLKLLKNHPANYFQPKYLGLRMDDDHSPFLKKGVRILHVIPACFPKVWHKESDNKQNLDFPTSDNLNKIIRIFVVEYLHLEVS